MPVLVTALPAILLIDSDTVNWQLQNVSDQSRNYVCLQDPDGFAETYSIAPLVQVWLLLDRASGIFGRRKLTLHVMGHHCTILLTCHRCIQHHTTLLGRYVHFSNFYCTSVKISSHKFRKCTLEFMMHLEWLFGLFMHWCFTAVLSPFSPIWPISVVNFEQ